MKYSSVEVFNNEEARIYTSEYWRLRLWEECKRSERYLHFFSVLVFDPKPFIQGDAYEMENFTDIANLIRSSVRAADVLGIMEDKSFALILPETPREEALNVSSRLAELVELRREPMDIKMALYPQDGSCDSELLEKLNLPPTSSSDQIDAILLNMAELMPHFKQNGHNGQYQSFLLVTQNGRIGRPISFSG